MKGAVSAQKAFHGSKIETREFVGRNRKMNFLPVEGSKICPPGKPIVFYKSKLSKFELVARPGRP